MDTLTAEYEFVVKTLLGKLNRSVSEALQPQFNRTIALEVLQLFLLPYLQKILTKSNFNSPSSLKIEHLIDVVIVTCAEALYRRPASVILSDQRHRANYDNIYKSISLKDYTALAKRIRVIEGQAELQHSWSLDRENLKQIQELEDLFFDLFRCFHKAGL